MVRRNLNKAKTQSHLYFQSFIIIAWDSLEEGIFQALFIQRLNPSGLVGCLVYYFHDNLYVHYTSEQSIQFSCFTTNFMNHPTKIHVFSKYDLAEGPTEWKILKHQLHQLDTSGSRCD